MPEQRYAAFDGLNLTWETLEGVAKHNGPVSPESQRPTLKKLNELYNFQLDKFASAEAQISNLSDDIAYLSHDIDDGLRAELFSVQSLSELPIISDILHTIKSEHPELSSGRLANELTRRLISIFVNDLLVHSSNLLNDASPKSSDDVRAADYALISHSEAMKKALTEIRSFLFTNMWRHYRVNRMTNKAQKLVKELFLEFFQTPTLLPTCWQNQILNEFNLKKKDVCKARIIADYIASLTDREAMLEHDRLFILSPAKEKI